MDNEIKTWLYDILQSINEIDSYYENKPKIFKEYLSDTRTKRAIERNLEIIGEAVNRILNRDNNFKIDNAQKIIGTRNRIIHAYDNLLVKKDHISHVLKMEKIFVYQIFL